MSLLKAENISYSYSNAPFMKDISFEINSGEFVSVLGGNGSGKSTLFRCLCGDFKPKTGKVFYDGKDLRTMKIRERAKVIACIYQHTDSRFPFTCFETVEMGLYPHKPKADKNDIDFIKTMMEKTETIQFCDKLITEISGGELQRVLLARALVQKPKLLLLDEAMSGFDIAMRLKMNYMLCEMTKKENLTVISVRHDIERAFDESDRIIALKRGEILYNDKPKCLLNEKFFYDIFNVKAEIANNRFYVTDIN